MPNHHEIVLRLVKNAYVLADPSPAMHVGDTVRYSSPHGTVRVSFPAGTPFAVSHVHDGHHHTVKAQGHFKFQCFITPTGKAQEIGWSSDTPQAGGEHDVLPGS